MLFTTPKKRNFGAYASPWLVIGATCILAVVVAAFASMNINREKRYMSQLLSEKGAALIKAIEAGARTGVRGMFGPAARLETLVEETAKLPDIFFIAITDAGGMILVHSERDKVGATLAATPALPDPAHELKAGAPLQWQLVEEPGGRKAFMVYKRFEPLPLPEQHPAFLQGGRQGRGRGGPPWMGGRADPDQPAPGQPGDADPFLCTAPCQQLGPSMDLTSKDLRIFVGMDIAPFEAARAEDLQHTLLMSAILLALGFAGVVSLFWAHNYRVSRRQLLDTRALASEVVANLPVGCVVTDRAGRVVLVNPEAARIAARGKPVAAGTPAAEILPAELLALAPAQGKGPPTLDQELECSFEGGRPVPLRASAAAIVTEEDKFVGQLFILSDLREVRRLQEQIRRSEKLAAVGNLAAGVAHEIRNPLSSIKGYAAYFRSKFPAASEEAEAAHIMVREVDRLNRVISELLEFARPSDLKPEPTSLAMVVEHALKLVRPDATHNKVWIEVQAEAGMPPVTLDPDRMSQALLNLFLNSIQAMPDGGTLAVRVSLDRDEPLAVVEIADQGAGIASEHLAQIFNPYFTTKGAGTGLGLAIVHKIVDAHQGRIKVKNAAGKGSVFTLTLPLQGPAARVEEEHGESSSDAADR